MDESDASQNDSFSLPQPPDTDAMSSSDTEDPTPEGNSSNLRVTGVALMEGTNLDTSADESLILGNRDTAEDESLIVGNSNTAEDESLIVGSRDTAAPSSLNEEPPDVSADVPIDTCVNEPNIQKNLVNIEEEADGSIKIGGISIPAGPIPSLTYDSAAPRLMITELYIKDFKSYAGEQRIRPFHKNFSTVIGPNGSGKSNVIDALLFVFGHRATKIRSKKISVLIHKSEKHQDVPYCTVAVHFAVIRDQGDGYDILPDSEFNISRTGFKDNSSVYEISGRRAQYKEVSRLLNEYGIDLQYNRFLILQGEIELIAMMKAKGQTEHDVGMLEYLEDIVGTNRFIEPIQEFSSKVEELNDKRIEKLNQLKILEKEKEDMEGPKEEAVKYIKLENKKTLIENSMLQVQLSNAKTDLTTSVDEKKVISEKIESATLKLNDVQLLRELAESEHDKLNEVYENHLKEVENFKQEYNELERQDVVCRENLNHEKTRIKKLVKSLDAEEKNFQELKDQPKTLKNEIEELKAKLVKLEAKKDVEEQKMSKLMTTLKSETADLQEEKEKHEAELVQLNNVVLPLKSEMDLAQSELDLYLRTEKKEEEKLLSLESDHKNAVDAYEEKSKYLAEAERRIPEVKTNISTAKQQLLNVENSEKILSDELQNKHQKVDDAKNSFSTSHHRNAMLKAFAAEAAKGRLTGVYGRLGDLGAIDDKYDIAISTACGNLDHIVTDTLKTAQDCVNFLKDNNLGYAHFIALEKMDTWKPYVQQKISTPENVPRLFDLIKVRDPDVLPAFYFSLRDTLVAKDLDQATRIGLQGTTRFRVVTLKGALIDLSGTMSGGGSKVQQGRMGKHIISNSVSADELQKMEEELEQLTKNVTDLRKSKQSLQENIEVMTKELSELEHLLQRTKMQINGLKEGKSELATQIKTQKQVVANSTPDKNTVDQLENSLALKKKSYEKASKAASIVEVKVKSLLDKIMEITKGKFGAVQKNLNNINKEIDNATQNITKNTGAIKANERKIVKMQEKIDSFKTNIEESKKTQEELRENFDVLTKNANETLKKKNDAMEKAEKIEEAKSELSKSLKDNRNKEHALKSDLIEYKNKLKACETNVKQKDGAISMLKSKLSKLVLHKTEQADSTELPTLAPEEIQSLSVNALAYKMGNIESELSGMKPNLDIIQQYLKKEEVYMMKAKDVEETTKERDLNRSCQDELRRRRLLEFMKGFSVISSKLKELYQVLTFGGDAELELVDSLDPFSEGIVFSVRPPKKSWKNISNLSGGEKTLSSLALVFALHYYRPTPFYVLDEIDAALDFRNVSIVGSYVRKQTKNCQFIIISLRNNMFELTDHLIGIYKTDNCTKQIILSNLSKFPGPENWDGNECDTHNKIENTKNV